jgi:hypothetical protein
MFVCGEVCSCLYVENIIKVISDGSNVTVEVVLDCFIIDDIVEDWEV